MDNVQTEERRYHEFTHSQKLLSDIIWVFEDEHFFPTLVGHMPLWASKLKESLRKLAFTNLEILLFLFTLINLFCFPLS